MKKLILTGMILTGIQMMAHIPPIIYNIKNNSIYWINEEIKGVDLKTLIIITDDGKNIPLKDYLENYDSKGEIKSFFIKDKNNVYSKYGGKIEGVDFKTFEILKNGYSKDKNNVYYKGQKIEEADSETFEITISPYDRLNASHEAKDKNHKYHYGKIITN